MSNEYQEFISEETEFDLMWNSLSDKTIVEIELEIALQTVHEMGKVERFREFCNEHTNLNIWELIVLFFTEQKNETLLNEKS